MEKLLKEKINKLEGNTFKLLDKCVDDYIGETFESTTSEWNEVPIYGTIKGKLITFDNVSKEELFENLILFLNNDIYGDWEVVFDKEYDIIHVCDDPHEIIEQDHIYYKIVKTS